MAAAPVIKIYREGEYVASVKYTTDAAKLMYSGGEVRLGHEPKNKLWREGKEVVSACDDVRAAARIMQDRIIRLRKLEGKL